MRTFYSKNDYRAYIKHYGVMGMKWGVRKARNMDDIYARRERHIRTDENKKAYKEGAISKEQYKANKKENRLITKITNKERKKTYSDEIREGKHQVRTGQTAGKKKHQGYDALLSKRESLGKTNIRNVDKYLNSYIDKVDAASMAGQFLFGIFGNLAATSIAAYAYRNDMNKAYSYADKDLSNYRETMRRKYRGG